MATLELIQLIPCALNETITTIWHIKSNHWINVWGWWEKSSHVIMEAWDEYTSMIVVRVLSFMVRSYVNCLFHHHRISFGVYYLFYTIQFYISLTLHKVLTFSLHFIFSITIARLCNNQKFKIMKENCIFEGKEMVVGENRDWEI